MDGVWSTASHSQRASRTGVDRRGEGAGECEQGSHLCEQWGDEVGVYTVEQTEGEPRVAGRTARWGTARVELRLDGATCPGSLSAVVDRRRSNAAEKEREKNNGEARVYGSGGDKPTHPTQVTPRACEASVVPTAGPDDRYAVRPLGLAMQMASSGETDEPHAPEHLPASEGMMALVKRRVRELDAMKLEPDDGRLAVREKYTILASVAMDEVKEEMKNPKAQRTC